MVVPETNVFVNDVPAPAFARGHLSVLGYASTDFSHFRSYFERILSSAMAASSSPLKEHQNALIKSAMKVDSLKFGSFTLKSGRYASHCNQRVCGPCNVDLNCRL